MITGLIDRILPRKHQFTDPSDLLDSEARPMPEEAPNWIGFTCRHCGKISGLEAWQIESMPVEMATCDKSPARMSPLEAISRNINCLAPPAGPGRKK